MQAVVRVHRVCKEQFVQLFPSLLENRNAEGAHGLLVRLFRIEYLHNPSLDVFRCKSPSVSSDGVL